MKADLITIFPSVTLDTKKWGYGKQVRDGRAANRFAFGGAELITYRGLLRNRALLKAAYLLLIRDERKKCIDGTGSPLDDFVLSIETGVEIEGAAVPSTDTQQLITYFAYDQHADYAVEIETIKVLCFPGGDWRVYYDDRNEIGGWGQSHSYLLPIEQSYRPTLKIRRHLELILVEILETLKLDDPERYRRVLTSMTLFNEACRASRHNSNAAIVLIVSSLESLLHLPRWSKKEIFGYGMKALLGFDDRIEKWSIDLYDLRSQIVHGDVPPQEALLSRPDRHYPNLDIARDLYSDCLWLSLASYGRTQLDPAYKPRTVSRIRNQIVSNKEKLDQLLRERSKFTYQAFKANLKIYKKFLTSIEKLTATDYSGAQAVRKVLNLILAIMEPWTLEQKARQTMPGDHAALAQHFVSQAATLDEILHKLREVATIKQSTIEQPMRGNLELNRGVARLRELSRRLEPVMHDKSEFRFTPAEFLHRSLNAIFATY